MSSPPLYLFDPVVTVAYLANQFPTGVEPYVGEEIHELRQRGVRVIAGSVRAVKNGHASGDSCGEAEVVCLQPIRGLILLRGLWLMARRWKKIRSLVTRVVLGGEESPTQRLKALLHTWLGAYYAAMLETRGIDHIHVHHGYFGSWIAMVAAQLLGRSFSMTLHGSDLLLKGHYLDAKLKGCSSCITISKYNRDFILPRFPGIDPAKIIVSRLGVEVAATESPPRAWARPHSRLSLLAVGRLHRVKDHAFLVRACARLRDHGLDFECAIAGDGPERKRLELLIRKNKLEDRVTLLGHVERAQIDPLYGGADLIVLTSRSEGIPLVLMEAMARGKMVLAPAITGIPELVIHGKTGFLYPAGALDEFVNRIVCLHELIKRARDANFTRTDWIRHAARVQVLHNFNRGKNLSRFGDRFLQRATMEKLAADKMTARILTRISSTPIL